MRSTYCRMALMNLSELRKDGPLCSRIDSRNSRLRIFDCRVSGLDFTLLCFSPTSLEAGDCMDSLHRALKQATMAAMWLRDAPHTVEEWQYRGDGAKCWGALAGRRSPPRTAR